MPLDARALAAVPEPASPTQPSPVAAAPAKIDVSRMNFYYGSHRVLDQINVKVMPNEVTALIGPSGCG
jgi:ABC-type multidrug transport system fused ATPase/permease subunit